MSQKEKKNMAASVLQRLKNYSQGRKEDRGLTITNYAIERFLYRLSCSRFAEQYVLKGAQLFRIWTNDAYRPTRDLDLLKYGSSNIPELVKQFQEICCIESEVQDGIVFLADTVKGEVIREDNEYDGVRIRLEYRIGRTGEFMQIDIGFGDATTPPAERIEFPVILKMPAPTLRAYAYETAIAEKVEAMVTLGMANSRMKDFYDVYQLSVKFDFNGMVLSSAIQSTFGRGNVRIPTRLPIAFTGEFCENPIKQTQWAAFLRKNSLEHMPFSVVVGRINAFIMPVFEALNTSEVFSLVWDADNGWR